MGGLEKNMESRSVMKPKFTTDFPEAATSTTTRSQFRNCRNPSAHTSLSSAFGDLAGRPSPTETGTVVSHAPRSDGVAVALLQETMWSAHQDRDLDTSVQCT